LSPDRRARARVGQRRAWKTWFTTDSIEVRVVPVVVEEVTVHRPQDLHTVALDHLVVVGHLLAPPVDRIIVAAAKEGGSHQTNKHGRCLGPLAHPVLQLVWGGSHGARRRLPSTIGQLRCRDVCRWPARGTVKLSERTLYKSAGL